MSGSEGNSVESSYIEKRAFELMRAGADYCPNDLFRMGEALQQACDNKEVQATINDYIEQKDWAKLGLKLFQISFDYMEGYAKSAAENEVCEGTHL